MSTHRPLTGCVVGISIAETEDMERLGFDRSEMNRCIVRLSESLLAVGARLAFGHDWRPGGVMVAVAALAVRYFHSGIDLAGESEQPAPIINRVPWPDIPFLSPQEELSNPDASASAGPVVDPMARRLQRIVDARQATVPPGVPSAEELKLMSPQERSRLRGEALSLMRGELADLCDVRVCLGGKLSGYSGKMPGIIEEALGALGKKRPVFASDIFGGASTLVARAMDLETDFSEDASLPDDLRAALVSIRELSAKIDRGLTPVEEKRLWHCTSTEQCVELILRGAVKCFSAMPEKSS